MLRQLQLFPVFYMDELKVSLPLFTREGINIDNHAQRINSKITFQHGLCEQNRSLHLKGVQANHSLNGTESRWLKMLKKGMSAQSNKILQQMLKRWRQTKL